MIRDRWTPSSVRQWRPIRALEDAERFVEDSIGGWPVRVTWRPVPGEEMSWEPSMEMYEFDDKLIVRAELPGVSEEEIDISIMGDTLTIRGHRKSPRAVKSEQYHRSELPYGRFSRSITLPVPINADAIEAICEKGILEIQLAKAREAISTKIEVKTKQASN